MLNPFFPPMLATRLLARPLGPFFGLVIGIVVNREVLKVLVTSKTSLSLPYKL